MRLESFKHLIGQTSTFFQGRSSAKKLKKRLLRANIPPSDINDSHISVFYDSLIPFKDRPTFVPIKISESIGHLNPPTPVLATIIETRKHINLEHIVLRLATKQQLPIQIFHGNSNKDFLLSTNIKRLFENHQVVLTQLDVDDLSADSYNSLLLSIPFWERLHSRQKILVFQTDTALCGLSPYQLEDFFTYDYIGSQWPRNRPIGATIDGGNGGLSLRDWAKSRECLNRFAPTSWPGGEDSYFAFHIDLIGGRVARTHECARFSTQYYFRRKSWGAHKVSCLRSEDLSRFLRYCPEARNSFL